jgi:hypothetical protein
MRRQVLALLVALSTVATAFADSGRKRSPESLAREAIAAEKEEAARAALELRAMGPEGLRAFLDANRDAIDPALKSAGGSRGRVLSALDALCQQKDCYASRLYWYTDIEQAKAAARASGKPILSLRLLGRLDEDLSCANSRFFRVTLYANDAVSQLLRDDFILHWESVRPVPKVTIDFGDGRKLERTLAGNSIHYVLDAEGRPIDALPGLYGPKAFVRELMRAKQAANTCNMTRTEAARAAELRTYHETRYAEVEKEWLADVNRAGLAVAPSRHLQSPPSGPAAPSAEVAARAAMTKAVVIERPVLRGLADKPQLLDAIANDAAWSGIAKLYAEDSALDEGTKRLMRLKNRAYDTVVGLTDSFEQAVKNLQRTISEDTVRNEYIFHQTLRRWFATGQTGADVRGLNDRVYAELFLTPGWDRWLGLRPEGSYSGLDNDGVPK